MAALNLAKFNCHTQGEIVIYWAHTKNMNILISCNLFLDGNMFFSSIFYFMVRNLWWRHQMETFSALLAICAGLHRSPVNSRPKGQWRGDLMFSLICCINGSVNNSEAGDLRRHRAHYDVSVMQSCNISNHEHSKIQMAQVVLELLKHGLTSSIGACRRHALIVT